MEEGGLDLKTVRSKRWKRLSSKGARPQRLLWASTGMKNPAYRDVCYIEPLIGHDTVTTMPEQTILAFADHGNIHKDTIEQYVTRRRPLRKNWVKWESVLIISRGNSNMKVSKSLSRPTIRRCKP